MSVEHFHNPRHLQEYDTDYIGLSGNHLEIVVEELDDLLYPDTMLRSGNGAQRARASAGVVFAGFNHDYLRTDMLTLGWAVESVRLSVDHTQYLGKSALKQCYKIKIDTSVEQSILRGVPQVVPPKNRVTSMYYVEEFPSSSAASFYGYVLRPNIMNEQPQSDERMTAYDCNQLYNVVNEVRRLVQRPANDMNTL